MEDAPLAARIGEQGRAHVRRLFAADRVRETNRAYYRQCIGAFGRRGNEQELANAPAAQDSVETP